MIRETEKRYCSAAMTIAIIIGFSLIIAGQKPIGKGLILGTIFSVINFIIMGETLSMRLDSTKVKNAARSLVSIFIRYSLMAVPLVVSIRYEAFNIFATIFGLFMIQVMILGESLFNIIFRKREKQF